MPNLNNTGRIKSLLDDDIREQVFGHISTKTVDRELQYYALIDYAHITMLMRKGIVNLNAAGELLKEISQLFVNNFNDLLSLPSDRGTYLCYENYLISKLGARVGGLLQTGRSRNDLNATVFKMRLRERVNDSLELLSELISELHKRGLSEQKTLFPAFTHYQTAFTSTLGHYLTGIETQVLRDSDALFSALKYIEECPLGACAGGGTTVPIDRDITAQLLGFVQPAIHSIDAVASRDSCIHLLSAMASLGTTMSRLAADIVFFSSNEIALLNLPDTLVGSSSNMPQKRNPFLLEIVKGRSAAIVSAWTHTVTAMQWNAFSNSVAISSEATRPVWSALDDIDFVLKLMTKVIAGLEVNIANAIATLESGMVDAVYIAEQLVINEGVVFRDAHHQVGAQVTEALANNTPLRAQCSASSISASKWFNDIAEDTRFGGGCGDDISLETEYQSFKSSHRDWLYSWQEAIQQLTDEIQASA